MIKRKTKFSKLDASPRNSENESPRSKRSISISNKSISVNLKDKIIDKEVFVRLRKINKKFNGFKF